MVHGWNSLLAMLMSTTANAKWQTLIPFYAALREKREQPRQANVADVGANDGKFTRGLMQKFCNETKHLQSINFLVVEPQAQFRKALSSLSTLTTVQHPERPGHRCEFEYLQAAAWHTNGSIPMLMARDSRASSISETSRNRVGGRLVRVPTFDLSLHLLRIMRWDHLNYLKCGHLLSELKLPRGAGGPA
jgi:hypothetical protein